MTSPPRPARRLFAPSSPGRPSGSSVLAVSLPLLAYMATSDALGYQAATRWLLVGGLVVLFGGEPGSSPSRRRPSCRGQVRPGAAGCIL